MKIKLVGYCMRDEYTNISFTYKISVPDTDKYSYVGDGAVTISIKSESFEKLQLQDKIGKEVDIPGKLAFWKNETNKGKVFYTPYLKAESL